LHATVGITGHRALASTMASIARASQHGLNLIGCIVIHRHGARAPVANLFCPDSVLSRMEENFWLQHTMRVDQQLEQLQLGQQFPTTASFDTAALITSPLPSPFGALTDVGAQQLLHLGSALRDRYSSLLQPIMPDGFVTSPPSWRDCPDSERCVCADN
jgi:hypothetical protein